MNYSNYLEDLATIVNIPSYSDDGSAVNMVNDFLIDKFESLGLKINRYKNGNSGDLIVARSKVSSSGPKILLSGHTDIVRLPKFTSFSVNGDKCFGSGVADMKSGLVVIIGILDNLVKRNKLFNVTIVLTPDEEIGSLAHQEISHQIYAEQEYAFVFEPSLVNDDVDWTAERHLVIERSGFSRYHVKLSGDGGHAGNKLIGRNNTIEELSAKILKWQSLADLDRGIVSNVGVVRGGSEVNVIAPIAEAWLEVRAKNPEDIDKLDYLVKKIAQTHKLDVKEYIHRYVNVPPMNDQPKSFILRNAAQKIFLDLGLQTEYVHRGGASDANQIAQFGVAVLDGLGGVGMNIHAENEWIYYQSIYQSIEAVSRIINEI